MNTYSTKKEDINPKWILIDAKDQVIGRLATKISRILTGKDNIKFVKNLSMGDKVIVINSDQLKFTGSKMAQKKYHRHSGFAGGHVERTADYYMKKDSTFLLKHAVSGMLPKNKMRDVMLKNLRIFKDNKHKHEAQLKEIVN